MRKIMIFYALIAAMIVFSISSYAYLSSGYNHGRLRIIPSYGSNVITLENDIITTLPEGDVKNNATIDVLNKQEYPELYGYWTVMFKTYGKADLLIQGENKTGYARIGDNSSGELEIISLLCGERIVFESPFSYLKGIKYYPETISIKDYSCKDISYWKVRLLGCDKHTQKFVFGKDYAYAKNDCTGQDDFRLIIKDPDAIDFIQTCSGNITERDANSSVCINVQSCSLNVTCQKAGNYTARVNCTGCIAEHPNVSETIVLNCSDVSVNKFIIKDSSGNRKAAFDENGYLFHAGTTSASQGALTAPSNSFMIKNSSLTTIMYIDSSGNLKIAGTLTENQTTVTPPSNSFIIKNSAGTSVAYIDSSGNLVLKKYDYESWLDSI